MMPLDQPAKSPAEMFTSHRARTIRIKDRNRRPSLFLLSSEVGILRPIRLRLPESEQLCELVVEHSCGKKSGQSPVLETLRNDRVAGLWLRRAECLVDGFAKALRG